MEGEIRKLKQWSLVFLCLLLLLCVRISSLKAQQEEADKCIEYYTEIIQVQKFRHMLQIGADEMIRRYDAGNLTKEELDTTLGVWYSTESKLKARATKLYEAAQAERCFDEP